MLRMSVVVVVVIEADIEQKDTLERRAQSI